MDVFLSWSGERSRRVAALLGDWLPTVLQAATPWISTSIQSGASWATEINSSLSNSKIGILCVTKENRDSRWILFEAGALAKGLDSSRVIPLLVDMPISDLVMPLSQFNACDCNQAGLQRVISTINAALPNPVGASHLQRTFEAVWPAFENGYNALMRDTPEAKDVKKISSEEKIDDLQAMVRSLLAQQNNQPASGLKELDMRKSLAAKELMQLQEVIQQLRTKALVEESKIFDLRRKAVRGGNGGKSEPGGGSDINS